ncbi:MAG: alanine--tRNA ligase [Nitrospirota bacterium]
MESREIRRAFLEYFKSKHHRIVPSSPLIPRYDPTLLFVAAGMVQFKRYFLGEERSPYSRAASCQKCLRAGGKQSDLENVGHTARHHTFFEMLGNFSFGDYFKREAITFAWELLTGHFNLPRERLWASVFEEDEEATILWREVTDIEPTRIVRFAAKDNFWQMGDTGPCGPCSEIIIDQGESVGCRRKECSVHCDCDRFLELWNLVFMQYNRDEKGRLIPLPRPSIDTGMGLERISAVLQNKTSNFDSDLFQPIINNISSLTGASYGPSKETDISIRVVADHIRAITFLLSEGIIPSNEGRGYVLRRIIRRALRHALALNMHEACLYKLIDSVITVMGDIYPEIVSERERSKILLKMEEEQSLKIVQEGMNLTAEEISKAKKRGDNVLSGEVVFRLYDTFGIHPDLTRDLAMDEGLGIDEEGFQREMELQRQRSRVAPSQIPKMDIYMIAGETEFVGYDTLKTRATVKNIIKEGKPVDELKEGEEGEIILDRTPFYGESGGQVGDTGTIDSEGSHARVLDTKKPVPGLHVHHVKIEKGKITEGERVICSVNEAMRKATMRNHTATHLLHRALRTVLGEHVKQSGSLVTPERLRFDFTHFQAMQNEEMSKVEELVNEKTLDNLPVHSDVMPLDEAIKTGALALFDEKYGETARVVTIGDFSKELCGGTHCKATGEIGSFIILSEGSVASGIRRIEAVTGYNSLVYLKQMESEVNAIKTLLKTDKPVERIEKLLNELKLLEKEIQKLKTAPPRDIISEAIREAKELDEVRVVKIRQDGLNHKELRLLADNVKEHLKSGIIVVSSVFDGQAAIVCMVTKDLKNTYNAGEIVREISKIAGGSGGGRPEMAQGGTKEIEKLDRALEAVYDIIKKS